MAEQPVDKSRLIAMYRDRTLGLSDAERLRDVLLDELIFDDATVPAGVLLIGVNALIERLQQFSATTSKC